MHLFTKEERKSFVKFITGSSRLPYGGLFILFNIYLFQFQGYKSLSPKLTIVKKHPNFGG